MVDRVTLDVQGEPEAIPDDADDNVYFINQTAALEFIDTGCAVLNCAIGGGWPLKRIANIIGDESTGKTLMAIEAAANFHHSYPDGLIFYRESESAFEEEYAEALGMPVSAVEFIDPEKFITVEDFFDDLKRACKRCIEAGVRGLYVCDSLDALTDEDELASVQKKNGFGKGTYGTKKAKDMGKLLRLCRLEINKANMCLIIVSQTRDKIGTLFPMKTRAGGRALDFYASQCLWLSHLDEVRVTRDGIKRTAGIRIAAKCKKNKIALPYRKCEFTIMFGQGIDSLASSLDFLEAAKRLEDVCGVKRETYEKRMDKLTNREYWAEVRRVDQATVAIWQEVDRRVLEDTRRKYRDGYYDE